MTDTHTQQLHKTSIGRRIREHYLAKASDAFWIGTFLGVLIFILIYGVNVIDVTNNTWLLHSNDTEGVWDLTQHYLGWCFYRRSPWQFPIGLVEGLYATPVSISYTDSIPLFAIVFKLFAPILPETFQYFGLFGVLCYALMGGFGALITRRFSSLPLVNVISSACFILSPVMLKRMFYHTALAADFLILAGICLWIYRDMLHRRTYTILWCIVCVASILINPYLTPMVLGILLCSLLQELLVHHRLLIILPLVLLPILLCGLAGWITGLFYGDVSAAAEGLDALSFNFTQFFNPRNYQLEIVDRIYNWTNQNYSAFIKGWDCMSPWQEEGFSYLGLGMIALLLFTVILFVYHFVSGRHKSACSTAEDNNLNCASASALRSYLISILIGLIVFTFLAISPTATWNEHILYKIHYNETIYNILSIFRSTGRLIWPVYFTLMTLVFIGCIRMVSSKKTLCIILLTTLVIQVLDLSPALSDKHEAYTVQANQQATADVSSSASHITLQSVSTATFLAGDAWDTLGTSANQIMFHGHIHETLYCDPEISCIFEEYALQYNLTFNITYLSRDLSDEANASTAAHFKKRAAGVSYSDIIYVFLDDTDVPDATETGLNYYKIDGYIIGTEQDLSTCSEATQYDPSTGGKNPWAKD